MLGFGNGNKNFLHFGLRHRYHVPIHWVFSWTETINAKFDNIYRGAISLAAIIPAIN